MIYLDNKHDNMYAIYVTDQFAWGNLGSSCTFLCFSQNQSFFFLVEDSGRKIVELGWDNFKNWADGWKNCDDNLKSWVDDWKNYWNDGSGLTVGGHYFLGSMRNWGDFSSQDCMLERKDHCSALRRPHSSVQENVGELETQDTPQTHDSWPDSKYNPELELGSDWLDWLDLVP